MAYPMWARDVFVAKVRGKDFRSKIVFPARSLGWLVVDGKGELNGDEIVTVEEIQVLNPFAEKYIEKLGIKPSLRIQLQVLDEIARKLRKISLREEKTQKDLRVIERLLKSGCSNEKESPEIDTQEILDVLKKLVRVLSQSPNSSESDKPKKIT